MDLLKAEVICLPIELQGKIIFEIGGFTLLKQICQISSKFKDVYDKQISIYGFLIQPIMPDEITEYLKMTPSKLWTIDESIKTVKYIYDPKNNYLYSPHTCLRCINNAIYFGQAGLTHCRFESDTELITNNKQQNYDIKTTYNIKNRNKSSLLKIACLDIFNHYCDSLVGNSLNVYLYVNMYMLDRMWLSNNNICISTLDHIKHQQMRYLIMDHINKF